MHARPTWGQYIYIYTSIYMQRVHIQARRRRQQEKRITVAKRITNNSSSRSPFCLFIILHAEKNKIIIIWRCKTAVPTKRNLDANNNITIIFANLWLANNTSLSEARPEHYYNIIIIRQPTTTTDYARLCTIIYICIHRIYRTRGYTLCFAYYNDSILYYWFSPRPRPLYIILPFQTLWSNRFQLLSVRKNKTKRFIQNNVCRLCI